MPGRVLLLLFLSRRSVSRRYSGNTTYPPFQRLSLCCLNSWGVPYSLDRKRGSFKASRPFRNRLLSRICGLFSVRSRGIVLEIQEVAAPSRPSESRAEIYRWLTGTCNPAATKPGAAISSLAACLNPKMTHKFCRKPGNSNCRFGFDSSSSCPFSGF